VRAKGCEGQWDALDVVLATGSMSVDDLSGAVTGIVREVYRIGDAVEPRNALESVKEGFLVGLTI
jgi:hypothetical protein